MEVVDGADRSGVPALSPAISVSVYVIEQHLAGTGEGAKIFCLERRASYYHVECDESNCSRTPPLPRPTDNSSIFLLRLDHFLKG